VFRCVKHEPSSYGRRGHQSHKNTMCGLSRSVLPIPNILYSSPLFRFTYFPPLGQRGTHYSLLAGLMPVIALATMSQLTSYRQPWHWWRQADGRTSSIGDKNVLHMDVAPSSSTPCSRSIFNSGRCMARHDWTKQNALASTRATSDIHTQHKQSLTARDIRGPEKEGKMPNLLEIVAS
jgi:hypothetical protein